MRQKPIYEAVEILKKEGILVSSTVSNRNVGKISYNSKDVNDSTVSLERNTEVFRHPLL